MAELPEVGVPVTDTLADIFENLRAHKDELMIMLPFETIGTEVLLRVTPGTEALFDIMAFCVGDENHERHLLDGREFQTEEEITEILYAVRAQEESARFQQAFAALMS